MDQVIQSLWVMLMGMVGIVLVMAIISLVVTLLNKMFSK